MKKSEHISRRDRKEYINTHEICMSESSTEINEIKQKSKGRCKGFQMQIQ